MHVRGEQPGLRRRQPSLSRQVVARGVRAMGRMVGAGTSRIVCSAIGSGMLSQVGAKRGMEDHRGRERSRHGALGERLQEK